MSPFPQELSGQLLEVIRYFYEKGERERENRLLLNGLPDGTAILVQTMVFGNQQVNSGSGFVRTKRKEYCQFKPCIERAGLRIAVSGSNRKLLPRNAGGGPRKEDRERFPAVRTEDACGLEQVPQRID